MSYRGIKLKDRVAALRMKPTGWRMPRDGVIRFGRYGQGLRDGGVA